MKCKTGKAQTISTHFVALKTDTRALAAQVAQAQPGLVRRENRRQARTPGSYLHHILIRFPHSLCHLMKEHKVVHGTDVNLLCDILEQVLKIHQVRQMTESIIYAIIYRCFRGELLTYVTQNNS